LIASKIKIHIKFIIDSIITKRNTFDYIKEDERKQSIKRHQYLDREYSDLKLDIMESPDLYARFPELQEDCDEDCY